MTSLTGQGAFATSSAKPMKEKIPSGYKKSVLQQYTPEQIQLLSSLFSHVGPESYISKLAGGDEEAFQQMEAPAFRQFSELLGGLGSRFSGMGIGARKSSGFQNVSGQAASSFAQDLAAKRQEMRRQAIMDLMGISSSLLEKKPYETMLVQKQKPWWQELLIGAGQGAAQGLTTAAMSGGA